MQLRHFVFAPFSPHNTHQPALLVSVLWIWNHTCNKSSSNTLIGSDEEDEAVARSSEHNMPLAAAGLTGSMIPRDSVSTIIVEKFQLL